MRVKIEWTDEHGYPLVVKESPDMNIECSLVVGLNPVVEVKGTYMTADALNQMAKQINDKITYVKFTFLE